VKVLLRDQQEEMAQGLLLLAGGMKKEIGVLCWKQQQRHFSGQ
jgi:hypothetical protein